MHYKQIVGTLKSTNDGRKNYPVEIWKNNIRTIYKNDIKIPAPPMRNVKIFFLCPVFCATPQAVLCLLVSDPNSTLKIEQHIPGHCLTNEEHL